MDYGRGYHRSMTDDLPKMLQEIMDLTGDKQAQLGKRVGAAQSTINRWLQGISEPNATKFDKVRTEWLKAHGYVAGSIDQRIARYDAGTQKTVHQMVDNYLTTIGPPKRSS